MDLYKAMTYVLKVHANMRSKASRKNLMDVLSFVCDTYLVSVDWETGITQIADSEDIDLVLDTLAMSGYKAELVRIIPSFPELTPKFRGVRRPHPRHVAYDDSSYLGDYGYGLPSGYQDSRISCTRRHDCHGRYEGALYCPPGKNRCHRSLPPCHHDNRIECTHHHHCHGRDGCTLHNQHGIIYRRHHDNQIGCAHHHHCNEGNGCAAHHQCHGGIGCAHHQQCHGGNGCALYHHGRH